MATAQSDIIGYDAGFGLDVFSRPRLYTEGELIKDILLYVLFSKPGQYPSIPFIGLDIQNILYSYYDEIDEDNLKNQIIGQCSILGIYFSDGSISIRKTIYNDKPSLLICVEVESTDTYYKRNYQTEVEDKTPKFQIGITFDELDKIIYNINRG